MSDWKKVKLSDVADIKLSNVDKKTNVGEKPVRLCNYTDVYKNTFIDSYKSKDFMIASCNDNEFEKFVLKKGQVAITKDSEKRDDIGISTYIAESFDDVVLGYHLSLITPFDDKLDGRFLNYWLNTNQAKVYFENNAGGSGQRCTLPIDIIKGVPLELPALLLQQKIASLLSALDEKIELNKRINAELEAMAKTLYDYWFVQFDFPVVTSSGVEKPYKSSGGKMVYNDTLKREIPEGWEVTVFNDWIKNTKAGDWGKESEEGNYTERVYCIRGADINGINGKGEIKAPERYILKSNVSKKLMPNDFVVEISGGSPVQSTGRIALITESTLERFDTDIICSNFCKAVSIKNESYIYNFKQEWQRLYDAGVFFGFEGKTSGIKNFLFDSFMNSYSIVLPKKEIVEKYYEYARSIDKKIQSNLKQNQELSALRDWLLPMLMNGQVRVSEAEEMMEELGMVAEEKAG